ncbi:Structural maintenance of chromosomes protein 1 [Allomyces arbusculus]|nr:Structural maintenance of chromosomes protein 1 [Allomyces arbusculus]
MGRLVQLEVNNFKSYRGHHVIGPFKQLTAVIGPNGAGKSNIMDAVSFVLGIQSAQLRSTHLRDLIYRGRAMVDDQGREVAGVSAESATSAYVSAVYEDANQNQITFTRTISADGKSEYRVNGKAVRREAYIAYLERENVLIKARNFLVFQGDVESVAAQNPKDLTRLIEQVSGSLDLKDQYETLKQAQDTAMENSTLMFQKRRGMQAELKQYREQKSEAEQYENMRQQRDELVLAQTQWKLFHLERDLERMRDSVHEDQGTLREYEDLHEAIEAQVRMAKQEHAAATKDVVRLDRLVGKEENAVKAHQPVLTQLRQAQTHSTQKVERLATQVEKIDRDLARQEQSLADLRDQIATITRAQQQLDRTASSTNAKRQGLAGLQDEYHRLRSQFLLETATLQQQLDSLQLGSKARQDEVVRLEAKRVALEQKMEAAQQELEQARSKHERASDGLARATDEQTGLEQEMAAIQTRDAQLRAQEQSLNEKLVELTGKLMDYRSDKRESERETKMRQLVEDLKSLFPGVYGRLNELCRPTQRIYDRAVALVLGKNMDAIVTDSQATAMECIRYMREQRKGHATFLPVQELVTKEIPPRLRSFANARPALDVVQYDKEIEPAVKYACGTALVTETLDVARYICYDKGTRVKAVTLDGVTIHKTGSMSGGTAGADQASGTSRWEEREVETMKRAHEKIQADLQQITKEKRRHRDREELQMQLAGVISQRQYLQTMVAGIEGRIAAKTKELEEMTTERDGITARLDDLGAEMADARVLDLQEEIRRARDTFFADFCAQAQVATIEEYEQLVLESAVEETKQRNALATQRTKLETQLAYETDQLAKLRERREQALTARANETRNAESNNQRIAQIEEAVTNGEAKVNQLREQLEEFRRTQKDKAQVLHRRKRQQQEVRSSQEALVKKIAQESDSITQLHHHRVTLLRKARVDNIPLAITAGSLADLVPDLTVQQSQELSQAIVVDYDDLDDDLKEDGSPAVGQDFTDRIHQLTGDMDRIAPNMRALEKLAGVTAKCAETDKEFEKARRDARLAKDRFLSVRQERYTRFMDAFAHISGCIDAIYKELTRSRNFPLGGTAYLSLESEDEPYAEGVKYHAMPPMKRFRDMEQLSGGEKTVAALALLFAIHSYRPSPFFVLDEVDAALDNANVAKVARYVVRHREDVQFIIISLKNSFYERCQGLVGVYRDVDANSSGILTLDLEAFPDE